MGPEFQFRKMKLWRSGRGCNVNIRNATDLYTRPERSKDQILSLSHSPHLPGLTTKGKNSAAGPCSR